MEYLIIAVAAAVLAGLLLCCVARAIRVKAPARPGPPAPCAGEKYACDLAEMLRVPTVTVRSGGQEKYFHEFHALLERLYPLTFAALKKEVLDGGSLLMHWPGAASKDERPGAIVLMSHSDVVPAGEGWVHQPFGGEISDGRIWGRGAIDTKGALCAIFEAVEGLLADGFTPQRDIYIASSSDEEISGDGASSTVALLVGRGVKIDLVLDEGGMVSGSPLPFADGDFALLGTMEKGYADMKVEARGSGGHASTPPRGTTVARLGQFIARVERRSPFKSRITAPFRDMARAVVPYMDFAGRFIYANLWLFGPPVAAAARKHGGRPAALVGTTAVFTMLSGSSAPNVIPGAAHAVANLRFMVHEPRDRSLDRFSRLAAKYGLEVSPWGDVRDYCRPSDITGRSYKYVEECVSEVFPDAPPVPFILTGGTDSRFWRDICSTVVRFSPIRADAQQLAAMHACDENIGTDALAGAVAFYRRVVGGSNEM